MLAANLKKGFAFQVFHVKCDYAFVTYEQNYCFVLN